MTPSVLSPFFLSFFVLVCETKAKKKKKQVKKRKKRRQKNKREGNENLKN
jgi:hypothetical protein